LIFLNFDGVVKTHHLLRHCKFAVVREVDRNASENSSKVSFGAILKKVNMPLAIGDIDSVLREIPISISV